MPTNDSKHWYALLAVGQCELALVKNSHGLSRVFPAPPGEAAALARRAFPAACNSPRNLADEIAALRRYFRNPLGETLNLKVDERGLSAFQRRVSRALRGVRAGRVITYGQLAAAAGSPGAARAVGGVMAKNPVPLVVPCHRVVRGDGGLGGFSAPGGPEFKRALLAGEGVRFAGNRVLAVADQQARRRPGRTRRGREGKEMGRRWS